MMAPSQSAHNNSTNAAANNGNASDRGASRKARRPVQEYLTSCKSLYSCIYCRTHLANHDELVSRSFQGNHGRAYLFNSVVNVDCGPAVQRELNTGSHAVADIYCANCRTTLGWKYEKAYVDTQKYKEGKYIIELAHVVRENRHLEFDKGEEMFFRNAAGLQGSNRAGSKRLQPAILNNHSRCSSAAVMKSASTTDNHQGSLTPPSVSGQWHEEVTTTTSGSSSYNYDYATAAAAAAADDDDDELMFPFYDDMMCASRSSYPNYLSSSQHNRMRRSLYLESTPYDWKYATTATASIDSNSDAEASSVAAADRPEFNQPAAPKLTTAAKDYCSGSSLADSGLSSDLSSPSASSSSGSSSSDASPEQSRQKSYHNNNEDNNLHGNYTPKGRSRGPSEQREHHDDETQFKFEADGPESAGGNSNNNNTSAPEQIKHCDHLDTLGCDDTKHQAPAALVVEEEAQAATLYSNSSSSSNRNLSEIEQARSRDQIPSSSSFSHLNLLNDDDDTDANRANAISLEDEEFYDCYTDHEVSSLVVESRSSS